MKIDSGRFRQEAVSSYAKVSWKRTSAGFSRLKQEESEDALGGDLFSGFLKQHGEEVKSRAAERTKGISSDRELSSLNKIRLSCLDYLFYLLFIGNRRAYGSPSEGVIYDPADPVSMNSGGERALSYSTESFEGEYEAVSYSTEGTVRCADGRELSFNLSFEMTQSFEQYYAESYSVATVPGVMDLTDPLVINLETDIASLSDQKFTFDLDADGDTEQLSMPGAGSGFLALDLNENGLIDDGTELFGAKTGSGFAELSAFDQDHNGWIDENDEIFDKLKIWVKSADGADALFSLKDKNVGAINLNALPTSFSHYGANGALNGMLRSSSFFLFEDGRAGTIQHMDLAG